MSQIIDAAGTYIGEITESALGVTKKSGYPQWVARLKALKKWVDAPDEIKHYELDGPGWVDWAPHDEHIAAYLVLFKASVEDGEDLIPGTNCLLNYRQLQLATGWDGTEFDSLNGDAFVGKKILFRVEVNEYDGKTSLQVNWVDAADAPVNRALGKLDDDKVKGMNKLLRAAKKKTKPAAAKPKTAKPKTTTPKPIDTAKTAPPSTTPDPGSEAEIDQALGTAPPDTASQLDAWNYLQTVKGGNDDKTIEEAWIAAGAEIGGERKEADFTEENWAKVRDLVVKDLALGA